MRGVGMRKARVEFLNQLWKLLGSLFIPSITLVTILEARASADPAAAVLQLFTWERDRLLTLAKGMGGSAITVLAALISAAVEGKPLSNGDVIDTSFLIVGLLAWGGFVLAELRRLAEQYPVALEIATGQ
jgi:hypothetical protein